MKALSLIVSVLIATSAYSQTDSVIVFRDIVKIDSMSKKEIGIQIRDWLHSAFNNPKKVIDLSDIENGQFFAVASFSFSEYITAYGVRTLITGEVNYKIKVEVKDGKYRYEIGPFLVSNYTKNGQVTEAYALTTDNNHPSTKSSISLSKKTVESLNEFWNKLKKRAENEASILSSSLKASVKSTKTSNDW